MAKPRPPSEGPSPSPSSACRLISKPGCRKVARLPLSRGDRGAVIDFRHLIGHLLRKPGAFAGYRWREELFPSLVYRAAYDHLARAGVDADRRYLEVLKLAADEGQTAVANALEHLLAAPRPTVSAKEVRAMLDTWRDLEQEWRERPPLEVCLSDYDALLDGGDEEDEEDEGPAAGEALEAGAGATVEAQAAVEPSPRQEVKA